MHINYEDILVALHPHLPPNSFDLLPHISRESEDKDLSNKERRQKQLVESFATICSHMVVVNGHNVSPVTSVAMELTGSRTKFYFASNDTPSNELMEHVAACFQDLKRLSAVASTKLTASSTAQERLSDPEIEQANRALVIRVYRFCYAKLRYRILKHDRCRQICIILRQHVSQGSDDERKTKLRELWAHLRRIAAWVEGAEDHAQLTDNVIVFLHEDLRSVVGYAKDEVVMDSLRLKLKEEEFQGKDAKHILDKICTLACALSRLSRVALAVRFKAVVEKLEDPLWIPSPPPTTFKAHLNADTLAKYSKLWHPNITFPAQDIVDIASKFNSDSNSNSFGLQESNGHYQIFNSEVHCECILIDHFLQAGIDVFPFIGCTKLSCYACTTYIRAVNCVHQGKSYQVRGSDGKICMPWSAPRRSGDNIKSAMSSAMFSDLVKVARKMKKRSAPLSDEVSAECYALRTTDFDTLQEFIDNLASEMGL